MTVSTAGLADKIVAAVQSIPGVIELDGGSHDEIVTQLFGRRIRGVRVNEFERVEVHIIVDCGSSVAAVAEDVRVAVRRLVRRSVDVCVEDVIDLRELVAA